MLTDKIQKLKYNKEQKVRRACTNLTKNHDVSLENNRELPKNIMCTFRTHFNQWR